MKTIKLTVVLLILFIPVLKASSTTRIITAGGMVFTPSNISVSVGDTIKWVWLNGIHTTTSTSVPSNAVPWNAFLDTLHPSYVYVISAPGTYTYQCSYHYLFGMTGTINANPTGVNLISGNVPARFNLSQNYPNPFNPSTNIRFDIAARSRVDLVIFDLVGNQLAVLVDNILDPGSYEINWNASSLPSGVYFYKLSAANFSATKKLMLIK